MSSEEQGGVKGWARACRGEVVSLCARRRAREVGEQVRRELQERRDGDQCCAVEAVRRVLWKQFLERREGITLQGHLASWVDDPGAFQCLRQEIEELWSEVGQGPCTEEVVGQVLAPFHINGRGELLAGKDREEVMRWPAGVLLLEDAVWEELGCDGRQPLEAVVERARARGGSLATVVSGSLTVLEGEQRLLAVYGIGARPYGEEAGVLGNLRVLFDARFLGHSLGDLELDEEARQRLQRGLRQLGTDLRGYTLEEIGGDERSLLMLPGIEDEVMEKVSAGLLALGERWRWDQHRGRWGV